jgi:hypothetical protein
MIACRGSRVARAVELIVTDGRNAIKTISTYLIDCIELTLFVRCWDLVEVGIIINKSWVSLKSLIEDNTVSC